MKHINLPVFNTNSNEWRGWKRRNYMRIAEYAKMFPKSMRNTSLRNHNKKPHFPSTFILTTSNWSQGPQEFNSDRGTPPNTKHEPQTTPKWFPKIIISYCSIVIFEYFDILRSLSCDLMYFRRASLLSGCAEFTRPHQIALGFNMGLRIP